MQKEVQEKENKPEITIELFDIDFNEVQEENNA